MPVKRDTRDYLDDIRTAIADAGVFVDGIANVEAFAADRKTVYAVIRCLEIIGEAARKIPTELRAQAPDVPWTEMCGMRDKLIHDYSGADLDIIWSTVTNDLPALQKALANLQA